MKSMQEQIAHTVKALNDMLEKLSDVSNAFGYSGDAAKYAEGRYREAAAGAEEAANAFEHMANEAREAEKAAKAALDAVNAYKNAGTVPAASGGYDFRGIPIASSPGRSNIYNGSPGTSSTIGYKFDTGGYTGA